ncbi:MAG: Glutathione hydrolase-like YwrD proenzyme [Chroococcopsis gigantea SAG 12.99]|jgi:gamma-glutamyltranspeptidase/glutathione hydrolase|nr:Glutathione hydrolase-like YwrD proenzyme [Chroococcopsis gigantea SAG 12.99]
MNLNHYPYPGQRRVILAHRYAVATSQHLASLAAIEIFGAGGNAVDAAIAAAISLTVVEPTSNGIGGDGFALVWDGSLHGFNGSGKSPSTLTIDKFSAYATMPERDWLTVTVPGTISLMRKLWDRWGKLPFEQLFAPAIRYAENGFPVSPVTAEAWQRAESIFLSLTESRFQPFREVFFPRDRAPKTGEIWGSGLHASTLEEIAATGGESFYRGDLARKIARFAAATGGFIDEEDLAGHQCLTVTPISTNYRGVDVWEIPPNGQGIAALMALNILEGYDMAQYPRDCGLSYHRQIEAMKLAFADVYHHVADAGWMEVTVPQLLDKAYARSRRELITDAAIDLASPGLPRGGTVYLCTADRDLMVSFIQSNYDGFGSGLLVPDTGIALHNRGAGFTLESGHPNVVGPDKRPFHTIIPGFLTRDGKAIGPFGVMGAPMQPQGHLQTLVNGADYGFNPQSILDAPRWRFTGGNKVYIEEGTRREIIDDLIRRGHDVEIMPYYHFGKGQIILRQDNIFVAASEPRADGLALGY